MSVSQRWIEMPIRDVNLSDWAAPVILYCDIYYLLFSRLIINPLVV